MEDNQLTLSGRVLSQDGRERIDAELSTPDLQDAKTLGHSVAQELSSQGADILIQNARPKPSS